jgi:hypothetical protein
MIAGLPVTVHVDQASLAKLNATLGELVNKTKRNMAGAVRQAMILALRSASRATRPGTSMKPSQLPDQYRYRNMGPWPDSIGYWYYHTVKRLSANVLDWHVQTIKLTQHAKSRPDFVQAGRAIWKWNTRKNNERVPIPYWGAKFDKTDRRFRIPHAGAAKAGWILAIGKLGALDGTDATYNGQRDTNRVQVVQRPDAARIRVDNLVKYVAKTSPQSATVGIRSAEAQMRHILQKEIDKLNRTTI